MAADLLGGPAFTGCIQYTVEEKDKIYTMHSYREKNTRCIQYIILHKRKGALHLWICTIYAQ